MAPNPEAIAWYVQRSEAQLADLRERVQLIRIRGGQLAGFAGAVLALVGSNAESILGDLEGAPRLCTGALLLLGSLLLIASLTAALRGTLLRDLLWGTSVTEVANYTSDRFVNEPDLWRVQIRTIRGLRSWIEVTTERIDEAVRAVRTAEYLFLLGLFSVGIAFATLIVSVTL